MNTPLINQLPLHWTIEQILALAPDPNTAKRGQGLANTKKWLSLESNGRAVWGKCKSSGSAHYETAIDLKGPAFKCNCPSRKFPCKHALGLLLISSSVTDDFRITDDLPEDIQTWLQKRDAKASPKNKEKTEEDIQKSNERKAKNFDKRMHLMQSGIKDLNLWIQDMIRIGLASINSSSENISTSKVNYKTESNSELWRNISMRMVDAKLSGLGRKIREMALIQDSGSQWPSQMLEELSNLFLITKGFDKIEQLPSNLQKEILSLVGVNTPKDDLLEQKGIEDIWKVVGQFEHLNIDNAVVRRTWFLGEQTQKYALILEYDYNNFGFPFHWPIGRIFKGEMIYYPSLIPLRAIIRNHEITENIIQEIEGYTDISTFLQHYKNQINQNPWIIDYPIALSEVYPIYQQKQFFIVDQQEHALPLLHKENNGWKIMALSGGQKIDIFGEWTGEKINPLGIVAQNRFIAL